MELTPEEERVIQRIIKTADCRKDFRCCEEGFENLCRALVYRGGDVVRCQEAQDCPMSYVFCDDIRFCTCRLRRYVALELGR